jgi:hypothetical protein
MIDNDVLVRRNRQPNVDLKSGAMAMLVAWSNNGYAASRNALVSRRSISFNISSRAAGDGSEPSKVISGAICISVLPTTV